MIVIPVRFLERLNSMTYTIMQARYLPCLLDLEMMVLIIYQECHLRRFHLLLVKLKNGPKSLDYVALQTNS